MKQTFLMIFKFSLGQNPFSVHVQYPTAILITVPKFQFILKLCFQRLLRIPFSS